MLRTPDRSADLVRGAAAYLPRNRPVTLETWGESGETIEAYRALGFEVMEEVPGWELRL
jgi:ribosomal protein S18 acetylase RimI-like enzyme